MKKTYKGFCPPFIAIGLVLLFMVVSGIYTVAFATDNVVPGSEVAHPGGSTTIYTEGTTVDTSGTTEPSVEVEEPQAPNDTNTPTEEPPFTPEQPPIGIAPEAPEMPGTTITTPEDPVLPPEQEVLPDPVGTYPGKIDTTGVTITSPSLDTLLADGADLEALLYPSGLKLPTKYMDLLMCAPVSYSAPVTSEAAYLLKTAAPTEDGVYTYAEYKAAELYLAICRIVQKNGTDAASLTSAALVNLDTNTSVNWMQNVTNATLTNSKRLVNLISNYKDLLADVGQDKAASGNRQYNDFVASHKGVRYSWGNLDDLVNTTNGILSSDQNLSEYITSLYSWWDYAGITQNLTSAVTEYSVSFDEFAYNGVNFSKGAPISAVSSTGTGTPGTTTSGEGTTTPSGDNQTIVSGDALGGGNGQGTVISGSSDDTNWTIRDSKDNPVAAVGGTSSADSTGMPSGQLGIREVGSTMALIFVIIAVICLWVIHISRRGGRFF